MSLRSSPPGRTPGQVPTPTGNVLSALGTPMREHLAPPRVNDEAWVAARFGADAVPDPAPAASGMTVAANTPTTGISTERRIVDPPYRPIRTYSAKDCPNRYRIRFDTRTIRTCLRRA